MRIPDCLATLSDYGIVQEVVRPLMSGKEAQVYLVVSGGKPCVAKVYKEAHNRSFKQRAEYTEGRKVRNSRDQRAIQKRSKHGRAQDEAAWRSTEVDMIHRLHAAGVRVPVPQHFIDGVLVMELITDAEGNPAPRLADLVFDPEGARAMYERLLREVLRMLCAGVVHGDLSDFNVLVGADGPVIIDFPQSVDTAHNANARKLLLRDVENLHRFLGQYAPGDRRLPYAEEMWDLFQQNAITPETRLTGRYRPSERRANTHAVLELIQDANYDERKRRESLGLRGGPPVDGASARGPRAEPARSAPDRGRQPHRPASAPDRGPQPHRPASAPQRDAPRPAPSQGQASQWRRSPQNGGAPATSQRGAPGAQHGAPGQRGAPASGQRGAPASGQRGAPAGGQRGAPAGGQRGAPGGHRDEARRIEVILARRPPMPR